MSKRKHYKPKKGTQILRMSGVRIVQRRPHDSGPGTTRTFTIRNTWFVRGDTFVRDQWRYRVDAARYPLVSGTCIGWSHGF